MDELREKYLQGKLSEAEREQYERSLSHEERKELAFEIGLKEGFESEFRKELKEKVSGFENQQTRTLWLNPTYVGVAASLILITTLTILFTGKDESLFDEYYEVYPNYEVTSLRGEGDLSSREKAYLSYDMGDYAGAIAAFNQLDAMVGADYFFRAMCYIQLQSYEEALTDLSSEALISDVDYAEATKWYTALVHIKMKNDDKALPLLKSLSQGNSAFAGKANELLEYL